MKRKVLKILGIVALVFAIMLINVNWIYIEVYYANLRNNKVLPEEYHNFFDPKTQKEKQFGNHQIKLVFESFDPIKHFISSNNDLIVSTTKIPKDHDAAELEHDYLSGGERLIQDIIYHKLDKTGRIIDEFTFKQNTSNLYEMLFDDYIVNINQKYYRTWIIDDDSSEKPIIPQNEDLKLSCQEQVAFFNKILEKMQNIIRSMVPIMVR